MEFGVEPDLATFGKALGNGYAITAVIGRRDIMEFAQSSFISSTFWTERLGPTAALKSLEVMERERSWEKVSNIGEYEKKMGRGRQHMWREHRSEWATGFGEFQFSERKQPCIQNIDSKGNVKV